MSLEYRQYRELVTAKKLNCSGHQQYVILNYCEGDLGELLQRGIKISTLHVRDFTHRNTLERMVYNLKILSINGKQVQIGKAPILSGRKESKEIEVRSHFDRRDVRSHFDHSAT